jgi:hypothetical protein
MDWKESHQLIVTAKVWVSTRKFPRDYIWSLVAGFDGRPVMRFGVEPEKFHLQLPSYHFLSETAEVL